MSHPRSQEARKRISEADKPLNKLIISAPFEKRLFPGMAGAASPGILEEALRPPLRAIAVLLCSFRAFCHAYLSDLSCLKVVPLSVNIFFIATLLANGMFATYSRLAGVEVAEFQGPSA